MSDCSQHKKSLYGEADMKKAARMILNMHYESLSELYKEMSIGLNDDAGKDAKDSKINLSIELMNAAHYTELAYMKIRRAWQISKPFMENKK